MLDVLVSVDCKDTRVVVRVMTSDVSVVRVLCAVARSARRVLKLLSSVSEDGRAAVKVVGVDGVCMGGEDSCVVSLLV